MIKRENKKMEFAKIKEDYSSRYNKELGNTGIFWAFSDKQFAENRTHKRKNENLSKEIYKNYVSIGNGGYFHKKDKSKVDNFFKVIAPKLKADFLSKADREEHILYELLNHECYYTYDISEVFDLMQDYYKDITEEEIGKIFHKYESKYAE